LRILITGSEGFVGTALKAELRKRGHEVWGCDLMHSADPQVIRADVAEARQLQPVFVKSHPHVTYHLAAEFGRANGETFYEQLWKSNAIGTHNVIHECDTYNSILAFASSSEAYGDIETNGGLLKEEVLETCAPNFHNEYALSKWTNERQIYMAARNRKLRAVVFRFFNAYGPGEHYSPYRSVVCLFIYRMLKGLPITVHKDSFRTHLWIGDLVNTLANLASPRVQTSAHKWHEPSRTAVFNIGSEEYESVEALYEKLKALIPDSKSEVTFLDAERANVRSKRPDVTRAVTHLYHHNGVQLYEGLKRTIEWMQETYPK
jgi:dTDP-glucose 4,6-dehydratase